jgi:hypothetical protein
LLHISILNKKFLSFEMAMAKQQKPMEQIFYH